MFLDTPLDSAQHVAKNFRSVRKSRKITIRELSARSGVSYSSVKRFEHTGEISFVSLIKIASVLNLEAGIRSLFEDLPPQTIEELIHGNNH